MPRRQFLKFSQPRLQALAANIQDPAVREWADAVVRALTSADDLPTLGARVTNSVDQTVNTGAPVLFNTARYNNGGLWSSTSSARLTAVQSGLYAVFFHCTLSAGASFVLQINGLTQITPANTATTVTLFTKWYFAQNDFVRALNAGGAVTVNAAASYSPEFMMQWLGPNQEQT